MTRRVLLAAIAAAPLALGRPRDDAPWLQALIVDAVAKGRTFFLPPGTYRLSRPLELRGPFIMTGVHLHGAGIMHWQTPPQK
jgi:hypothetical protein